MVRVCQSQIQEFKANQGGGIRRSRTGFQLWWKDYSEDEVEEEEVQEEKKIINSNWSILSSMSNMNIDIDKFYGSRDFQIWRRKIKGLLAQQKLLKALEDPLTLSSNYLEDQK